MKILVVVSAHSSRAVSVAKSLGEVVLLAVAPSDEVFAESSPLADGERIRIWDDCLDPSKLHRFDWESRVASVVAQAARRLGTPVVVLTDSVAGFLGAAVAEQLNLAHISEVLSARLDVSAEDDPQLHVRRRGLRGVQTLSGGAQAVLSVLPPVGRDTQVSASPSVTPVQVWSLDELSMCSGDLLAPQLVAEEATVRRHRPRLYIGAEALVERLRRDGLE